MPALLLLLLRHRAAPAGHGDRGCPQGTSVPCCLSPCCATQSSLPGRSLKDRVTVLVGHQDNKMLLQEPRHADTLPITTAEKILFSFLGFKNPSRFTIPGNLQATRFPGQSEIPIRKGFFPCTQGMKTQQATFSLQTGDSFLIKTDLISVIPHEINLVVDF